MKKFTQGYFKTAWADLTQDKRWWQPMLILSLVELIPVIGSFITTGYLYDWAKEASWGLKRPFTRQAGDVTKRLKYGFFAFVIELVWILPLSIVAGLLNAIPVVGQLLYLVCELALIVAAVVAVVAALRGLTYERIEPGLQIGRMLNMAKQDAGGLARCFLISLVGGLIVAVIAMIVIVPIIVGAGVSLSSGAVSPYDYGYGYNYDYGYGYDASTIRAIAGALLTSAPILIIMFLVLNFISLVVSALYTRACGYWLGQFEPARWGRSEDPMPFERATMANPYGVPYTGPQPGTAQPTAQNAQQQAQNDALYEEAKRATDVGSRAEQWDQEFAASQQAQAAAAGAGAGAAGAALLAGEVTQDAQGQDASQASVENAAQPAVEQQQSWIPQEVSQVEEPQVDYTAEEPALAEEPATAEEPTAAEEPATAEEPTAAEEPEVASGWRTATAAAVSAAEPAAAEEPAVAEEPTVAGEPVAEAVGTVVAEETVGSIDPKETVGAVVNETQAPQGWRSATASAVAQPLSSEPVAEAPEETATEAAEEPEEKQFGWRSASNAAN